MYSFADLISDDVWTNVETARSAAGLVANHTSAVVKAFSEVTLSAVSVATSFLEPLYTTLEFSPLQLRTSKELILILV